MRIRHKGLRALHEREDSARLPAGLAPRLRRILFRLQEAKRPRDADAPGFRLHPLKGNRAGQWSVRVSGNWPGQPHINVPSYQHVSVVANTRYGGRHSEQLDNSNAELRIKIAPADL